MQDRPDKATLLDAVMAFLTGEIQPRIEDKGLRFRVLIAAHLCSVVASEIRNEDIHDEAELHRLRQLLPNAGAGDLPSARETRAALFSNLNGELEERIQKGGFDDSEAALFEHLRATLRNKLSVANPRFDLSPEIEGNGC